MAWKWVQIAGHVQGHDEEWRFIAFNQKYKCSGFQQVFFQISITNPDMKRFNPLN